MHTSLSLNIQQMNDLSETLKERNEELGAIHAKVREADNLKMNFIHKIADKMIMPIKGIDGSVAHLEENCENITKEETQTLSEQMMSHAKAITDLLEQMLEIPKKKKNKTS
jgi:K+-sensing histidine kinase KdpD